MSEFSFNQSGEETNTVTKSGIAVVSASNDFSRILSKNYKVYETTQSGEHKCIFDKGLFEKLVYATGTGQYPLLCLSPDGNYLAAEYDRLVYLYRVNDGRLISKVNTYEYPLSMAFSADGWFLI